MDAGVTADGPACLRGRQATDDPEPGGNAMASLRPFTRQRLDRPIGDRPVPGGSRLVLAAFAGLLTLALSACGSSGATTTTPTTGQDGGPTVTIQDLAYAP